MRPRCHFVHQQLAPRQQEHLHTDQANDIPGVQQCAGDLLGPSDNGAGGARESEDETAEANEEA